MISLLHALVVLANPIILSGGDLPTECAQFCVDGLYGPSYAIEWERTDWNGTVPVGGSLVNDPIGNAVLTLFGDPLQPSVNQLEFQDAFGAIATLAPTDTIREWEEEKILRDVQLFGSTSLSRWGEGANEAYVYSAPELTLFGGGPTDVVTAYSLDTAFFIGTLAESLLYPMPATSHFGQTWIQETEWVCVETIVDGRDRALLSEEVGGTNGTSTRHQVLFERRGASMVPIVYVFIMGDEMSLTSYHYDMVEISGGGSVPFPTTVVTFMVGDRDISATRYIAEYYGAPQGLGGIRLPAKVDSTLRYQPNALTTEERRALEPDNAATWPARVRDCIDLVL